MLNAHLVYIIKAKTKLGEINIVSINFGQMQKTVYIN